VKRPLRLAAFAVPLSGNKGSASMFLGLCDAFRAAGVPARFELFSYYPARDRRAAKDLEDVEVHAGHPVDIAFRLLPAILMMRWLPGLVPGSTRRSVEALKQCDAVLLVGGTTFADSMLYKVPWNVLAALPAVWLGKRFLFLSQTIGPLRRAANRWAARWTLGRADAVHGRGHTSAGWVERAGIRNGRRRCDLSFSMSVPDFDEVSDRVPIVGELRTRLAGDSRLPTGVAPSSIVHAKSGGLGIDYPEFMANAIRVLHERGRLPVLIAHSYREPLSELHNNDRAVCERILARLPGDVDCFYLDADLAPRDLRAVVGRMDLLVASRFHAMVSALSTGVPPITYGWGSHKFSEVLDDFGVSELYADCSQMRIDRFVSTLDRCEAEASGLRRRIGHALDEMRRESDGIAQEIASLVA
jgi:colanic acid/amylovoran biosynthesis protein